MSETRARARKGAPDSPAGEGKLEDDEEEDIRPKSSLAAGVKVLGVVVLVVVILLLPGWLSSGSGGSRGADEEANLAQRAELVAKRVGRPEASLRGSQEKPAVIAGDDAAGAAEAKAERSREDDEALPSGEFMCEGHGYDQALCEQVGCCDFIEESCVSAVGGGACLQGDNDESAKEWENLNEGVGEGADDGDSEDFGKDNLGGNPEFDEAVEDFSQDDLDLVAREDAEMSMAQVEEEEMQGGEMPKDEEQEQDPGAYTEAEAQQQAQLEQVDRPEEQGDEAPIADPIDGMEDFDPLKGAAEESAHVEDAGDSGEPVVQDEQADSAADVAAVEERLQNEAAAAAAAAADGGEAVPEQPAVAADPAADAADAAAAAVEDSAPSRRITEEEAAPAAEAAEAVVPPADQNIAS